MFLTILALVALTAAWIGHALEGRATRGREYLSGYEQTRRARNGLKGFPWQYDVSARRSGRM